jgi:hypothetical protein
MNMDRMTAQVLALSKFLGISSIHEGWHANRFPRLVETVKTELTNTHNIDYHMGLDIDWAEWRPGHIGVSIRGLATSDEKYAGQWPLASPAGGALLEDLKALASTKAMQDIERERLEQLRREADARVGSLLAVAEGFVVEVDIQSAPSSVRMHVVENAGVATSKKK